MTKVDKQTKAQSGRFEVVDDLQPWLLLIVQSTQFEFLFQAFLIDGLKKSIALFRVNLKAGAHYLVALLAAENLTLIHFVCSVFRGYSCFGLIIRILNYFRRTSRGYLVFYSGS